MYIYIYIHMYAHIIYHHIIYIGISKSQVKYGLTGKCAGAGIREVPILGWVLEILETWVGLWCESLGLPVNFLI